MTVSFIKEKLESLYISYDHVLLKKNVADVAKQFYWDVSALDKSSRILLPQVSYVSHYEWRGLRFIDTMQRVAVKYTISSL